jgi:ribosomal protein S18 acetylase RimI-like enzyme
MVRDARPEDAAAIARVHTRSWQVAYAHAFPAEALAGISVERRTDWWAQRLAATPPRAALLVAEAAGEVRGFASVGAARDDGEMLGELYAIYVDPDHWGAGLGRALITEAEERLRAAGFAEAILWVLEDNPRTRRFYEAAGWTHDGGSKRDTHLGTEVAEVRYRKRLERR